MKTSLIVAMARNRVIGNHNRLPWHLPEDLRHFRELTMGKPMIMGRKTWDSIGRPLPGRDSIVISRQMADPGIERVHVTESLDSAFRLARELTQSHDAPECAVVGGAQIYQQALGHADAIYLTVIDKDFDGDTWFPELESGVWREVERESGLSTAVEALKFNFITLRKHAI